MRPQHTIRDFLGVSSPLALAKAHHSPCCCVRRAVHRLRLRAGRRWRGRGGGGEAAPPAVPAAPGPARPTSGASRGGGAGRAARPRGSPPGGKVPFRAGKFPQRLRLGTPRCGAFATRGQPRPTAARRTLAAPLLPLLSGLSPVPPSP